MKAHNSTKHTISMMHELSGMKDRLLQALDRIESKQDEKKKRRKDHSDQLDRKANGAIYRKAYL